MVSSLRWSKWIQRDLTKIQRYWDDRVGSTNYSDRLTYEVVKMAEFLMEQPQSGKKTSMIDVYQKVVAAHFLLIYRVHPSEIVVLRLWDTRQNPHKLKRYFK